MLYILCSVVCSVIVSVILKLLPRYGVDVRQAIAGNYLVASVLAVLLLQSRPTLLTQISFDAAWQILLALAVLLPSVFLVMAKSVNTVGIIRTDVAQRLSLIIPLIAAFTLFGELLTWQKGAGLLLGLMAILAIVQKPDNSKTHASYWRWPALVFLGLGLIDILFKRLAQLSHVAFSDVLLATFILAFIVLVIYNISRYAQKKANWQWRNIIAALLIGLFNFGNIVFYIKAHQQLHSSPALVFATMNIGVIVLASVLGVWLFKERLSKQNVIGLVLAVIAIGILASAKV